MAKKKPLPMCTKDDPDVRQCCCQCRYRLTDYHHCSTSPTLRRQTTHCVCGVMRGYICQPSGFDGKAHSHWPEHSVGCEMFTQKQEGA